MDHSGVRRRSAMSACNVAVVTSGESPFSTSTSPVNPSSSGRADATAWPVPRGFTCTTVSAGDTASATCSMPGATTTMVRAGSSGATAASTCRIIGRWAMRCSTLGSADFIRVPWPAARIRTARRASVMGARI